MLPILATQFGAKRTSAHHLPAGSSRVRRKPPDVCPPLHEASGDMLAAPPLWIEQGAHRFSEGSRFNGPLALVHVPGFKELHNPAAMRIIGFDGIDPFNRIPTS